MTDYNLAKDKNIPPIEELQPGDRLIWDESVTWEQLFAEADEAERQEEKDKEKR